MSPYISLALVGIARPVEYDPASIPNELHDGEEPVRG
jgi:hypothetical protein